MFQCVSKKHWWTREEDAKKCCNGWLRILVLNGGDNQQVVAGVIAGRAWVLQADLLEGERILTQ